MRVTFPIAVAFALMISTQPTAAQAGATVSKDLPCVGFIPTKSGQDSGVYISTDESVVLVKGNGSTSLSCHFDIAPGLEPAITTRASGFLCNTYLGSTRDSRMLASSGGNATLTCRIRTRTRT